MWQTTLKTTLKKLKNKLASDSKSTTNVWTKIPLEVWFNMLLCYQIVLEDDPPMQPSHILQHAQIQTIGPHHHV
jgi:hypothetical protein